jgi:hypothetical protein
VTIYRTWRMSMMLTLAHLCNNLDQCYLCYLSLSSTNLLTDPLTTITKPAQYRGNTRYENHLSYYQGARVVSVLCTKPRSLSVFFTALTRYSAIYSPSLSSNNLYLISQTLACSFGIIVTSMVRVFTSFFSTMATPP